MRTQAQVASRLSSRDAIRDLFVRSLERSGRLIRAKEEAARCGVLVLTLHRIVPDAQRAVVRSPAGMVLRESLFEALVAYLATNTTCIAASELGRGPASSSKPRVLVTFDDGWVDNAQVAWPVLKRAGIPMCIFVTTGLAGTIQPFWPERLTGILEETTRRGSSDLLMQRLSMLGRPGPGQPGGSNSGWSRLCSAKRDPDSVIAWLKGTPEEAILEAIEEWSRDLTLQNRSSTTNLASGQPNPLRDPDERLLNWQELQQLQADGVCFGSHTVTHPILTARSVPEVACELNQSRSALRDRLGETLLLAYPNGDANNVVTQEARRAGYRYGFSNTTGIWNSATDPLLVPRVNLWDGKLTDSRGRFSRDHLEYSIFWKALHTS
jgi:peptidoglycan/xylan/chitin deacetylase (PgdA/CDA1 family)